MTIVRGFTATSYVGQAADAVETLNALLKGGPDHRLVSLLDTLTGGQSIQITTTSDSTGVADITDKRGFRRALETISATVAAPANARVLLYNYDSVNEIYATPVIINAGAGPRGYGFDGTATSRSHTIPSGTLPMTAYSPDFEVIVAFTPAAQPPAAAQCLLCKGAVGQRGILVTHAVNGDVTFQWAPDKTNDGTQVTATFTAATNGISTSAINYLRMSVVAATGAVNFYKSADGFTWGAAVLTPAAVGATSMDRTGNAPWEIGGRGAGGTAPDTAAGGNVAPFTGTIYDGIQVRDGINGAPMLPVSVEAYTNNAGTGTKVGSATLHWFNGAVAGKDMHYLLGLNNTTPYTVGTLDGTSNRANKVVYPYFNGLTILNDGHNEANYVGTQWFAALSLWKTTVLARNPCTILGVVLQNPETIGTSITSQVIADVHIQRQRTSMAWASNNGAIPFDVLGTMLNLGTPTLANLIALDGVHPNIPGSGTDNGSGTAGYKYWAYALCRKFGIPVPTA